MIAKGSVKLKAMVLAVALLPCTAFAGELTTSVWPKPQLRWEAPESGYFVQSTGRIHTDAVWINDDDADHSDGLNIRRLWLGVKGGNGKNFRYLVSGDVSDEQFKWIDAYAEYDIADGWRVKGGHFKEHFGMEEISSNNNQFFAERSFVETFLPKRNTGLQVTRYGENWSFTGGVFTDSIENNSNEDHYGLTARATYAVPLNADASNFVHLGAAGSYREMQKVGFSDKPVTTITHLRAIRSGSITDVDSLWLSGLEFAVGYDALAVQGEYIRADVNRKTAEDSAFFGWYMQAAWMLTGERRPYSAAKEAVFGGIKPINPVDFSNGDWGAWELALRLDQAHMSDGIIRGGNVHSVTGGVNWYVNDQWKLMANVAQVNTSASAALADDDPLATQLRAQFVF